MHRFLALLFLLAPLAAQDADPDARVAAALRESRDRVAAEPENPEAWIARARTLLQAGLGAPSRTSARKAVEFAPDLAAAHRTLGQALSADSVGRSLAGDFDRPGAEAAFRRALQLDPEDLEARFGLALVLEHDDAGRRYAPEAKLDEASRQYAQLLSRAANEAAVRSYADLLFRLQRYEDVQELLQKSAPKGAEALQVAVVAALEGPPTAVALAQKTLPEDQVRKTVQAAARRLMQVRAYRPAAGLVAAASRGSVQAQRLVAQAQMLENLRPYDPSQLSSSDPADVGYRMLADMLSDAPIERLFDHRSRHARRLLDNPIYMQTYRRQVYAQRQSVRRSGLSMEASLDIAMSRRRARTEGDDALGYRVEAILGARPAVYFVVQEDGDYKMLDVVARPGDPMTDLAHEVLRRVDAGRVDRARSLLVWAYDRRQASEAATADPMSGPVFARFWEPDAAVGIDEARWAAATLMAETPYDADRAVEILLPGREQAVDDADRARFDIALATAYNKTQRDVEFLEVTRSLYEHFQGSPLAFQGLSAALLYTRRYDELYELIDDRLRSNGRDLGALQMRVQAAIQRNDLKRAREAAKELAKHREMGPAELNNLAWAALSSGAVDAEAVSQIDQAKKMLERSPNADLLNTAAALYADQGRLGDARRDLLASMRISGYRTPDSNSWFVFGRIAEQLGEFETARGFYAAVEAPKREGEIPTSPYALAQARLQAMGDQ